MALPDESGYDDHEAREGPQGNVSRTHDVLCKMVGAGRKHSEGLSEKGLVKEDLLDIRSGIKAGRYVNEATVSQGIVQRLLNTLGWPVYDTEVVAPEYSLGTRRADYALCHPPREPVILIEVKQVGQSKGADRQLFEYAFHKGVPMAILTDGQEWNFFLPTEQGDYSERQLYKIDILERDPQEAESSFNRYLEYEAVRSGQAIEAARKDYRNAARKRQAQRTLPDAWAKLIESEDELLMELLADKVEDLCGVKPDPDAVAAFLCEYLGMHVIERTDAFTLVGADARRFKLTLFAADGPREPGALKHVALRVSNGDGAEDGVSSFDVGDGLRLRLVEAPTEVEYDLDHVALYSARPTETAADYVRLGFEPAEPGPEGQPRVTVGGAFVEFHDGDPGESETPLLHHLAVLVDSAQEHVDEARELGVEVDELVDAPNTLAVFLLGPDRVRIEYVEHKPTFSLV